MGKVLMIQGTGSSVGKSVLVAALCRIFRQDGFSVAPFKSQNMALNSFVTREGGEMGRAQVVQAEAAGIEPTVDMNPILMKPEADTRCQIVVMGKPAFTLHAGEYYHHTRELLEIAMDALSRLRSIYDIVVIEGAGSPAEINLKEREIVNMKIALLSEAPVLLVGDIDRGGVFASLVGTLVLLDEKEQDHIKGFIINKFRGDITLLQPGLDYLEKLTSRPVIGVVPYYHGILIPEEDSIYQVIQPTTAELIDIAVIYLPHISNSTDFEPLQQETGVRVRYIMTANELGNPDVIIIPGSKSTVADLARIRNCGVADAIIQRVGEGIPLVGICGGFQMLGEKIADPYHTESDVDSIPGLGLLKVTTIFEGTKSTYQARARVVCNHGLFEGLRGEEVSGYEIHMGQTISDSTISAFQIIQRGDFPCNHLDGAVSGEGNIFGTYLHGLFDNDRFRHKFLDGLRQRKGIVSTPQSLILSREEQYDKLADIVRRSLSMELVYEVLQIKEASSCSTSFPSRRIRMNLQLL